MDFSQGFTTVHHCNMWGDWVFTFEGSVLCRLQFLGEHSLKSTISISEISECAKFGTIQNDISRRTGNAYRKAIAELNEYLSGQRKTFNIKFKLYGTEFQQKVWKALLQIPFGKTWSYKQLAEFIGEPKSVRAVGGALHANPLPIILPCHRVIGKSGALTGFGMGLPLKQKLLELEGASPLTFLE